MALLQHSNTSMANSRIVEPVKPIKAHCYLEVIGNTVICKHAVGPTRHADHTESYPAVPAEWLPVSFDVYKSVEAGAIVNADGTVTAAPKPVGRPLKLEERLIMLEARIKALEKKGH